MTDIQMGMVKALRVKADSGMMDCKKALEMHDWDFSKAKDYLIERNSLTTATLVTRRNVDVSKKYMVRLVDNYHNDLKFHLALQDIMVIHFDRVLPDFIIIQTDKELDELRSNPLFKSVEKERIGRVDI